VQNVMGVLFSASTFQGMFNFMNILPVLAAERAVFYRERAASMYSTAPYSSAVGLVEVRESVCLPVSLHSIALYFSCRRLCAQKRGNSVCRLAVHCLLALYAC
jgi:ABC-2 type transporter